MKKKMYLLGVFFLFVCSSFYVNDKKITIYIEEYDYVFTPQKIGCIDTIVGNLENGKLLKIVLSDCKGTMHIQYYKGKQKLEEGNYIASLDLLKKYITATNGITGKSHIRVSEYYQPLRSGTWIFYDTKGRVRYKKIYKEGIIQ